jgi:hypothetical protein
LKAQQGEDAMDDSAIHFVRVTTDDRGSRLWAAATAREDAIDRVLDSIPEGWSAVLVDARSPEMDLLNLHHALSTMARGDVRELTGVSDAAE